MKMFPSKKVYMDIYGFKYVKHTILMPVAWFHRLFLLSRRKYNEKANPVNMIKFNERMDMMKELGMID